MDGGKVVPWLGRVATLVMLAVLGWLGAGIYWTVSAPDSVRPSALMETDVQRAQQAIAGRHLFGVYVVASATASAPSDIRLNGVIAAAKTGQTAYAFLSLEGKPAQLVKEGDPVAPGITLQRVQNRQVELLRGGQTLTLRLPETSKPADPSKAVAANIPAEPNPTNPTNPINPTTNVAPAAAPVAAIAPTPAAVLPSPPPQPAPPRSRNRRNTANDND